MHGTMQMQLVMSVLFLLMLHQPALLPTQTSPMCSLTRKHIGWYYRDYGLGYITVCECTICIYPPSSYSCILNKLGERLGMELEGVKGYLSCALSLRMKRVVHLPTPI